MSNKLLNAMVIIASGVIAFKAVNTVRYYKAQKDLYDEIQEEAQDEK